MLHTLHVPHTSKAAHAVSPCNAVEVPTHSSVTGHTTMAWSASHFLSEVAALLRGSAPGRLLPIPPQSSQQLVCLGRARDAALLCRMASLPACRLQTLISLKCCSNAVARVTTCCSTQALQIAAPLWAQQIPPVSQFRFAEPKVQKQVQKQAAAAAAVSVVCQALPLVAVFGAATTSHDAALFGFSSPCRSCLQQQPQQQQQQQPSFLWSACRPESKVRVPPLAAGSLMAAHGGRLPQAAPTTAARSCTTITGAAD
ncbi:unnamed protein product [Polarella glacialis]|uniref:Uncharacterized protein n=1 Tax=Polarella glacialis TaxID=89957 RepID=A0A813J6P1_POLGL|nr:unnamed protein product [Polarella glacialis]